MIKNWKNLTRKDKFFCVKTEIRGLACRRIISDVERVIIMKYLNEIEDTFHIGADGFGDRTVKEE